MVTSKPPTTARQTDCLQGQDSSVVTHPSSSLPRRCLVFRRDIAEASRLEVVSQMRRLELLMGD
ncbi:hypothetical protein J6590_080041 [Homalodisca vitripennis]|nr:hypothetical protein J6590_080041 [Homalodisca vitripennis]